MIAAIGKQLKQSVKVFHNLMLNLRLPENRDMSCQELRVQTMHISYSYDFIQQIQSYQIASSMVRFVIY